MVPLKDLAPEILRGLSVPREALGWSGKAWDSADAENFLWRRDAASWRVRILDGRVRLPTSPGAPLASPGAPLPAHLPVPGTRASWPAAWVSAADA